MTLLGLLILLLIAGVCGSLGAGIGGYSHAGCFGSVVLGFIGAVFGMWIARQLTLPQVFVVQIGGVAFPVVWSVVGSAVFVAILGLFRGRRND
ncbi:MAG TPA: hypothetical protein VN709_00220 [Terriglobales bacterium]|nr:hypothetical protein [Terriglobales bacterium]